MEDALWRLKPRRRLAASAVAGAYPSLTAGEPQQQDLLQQGDISDYLGGETEFEGTCRMAIKLERFTVVSVEPPRVKGRCHFPAAAAAAAATFAAAVLFFVCCFIYGVLCC